jgi:hypothetical protein
VPKVKRSTSRRCRKEMLRRYIYGLRRCTDELVLVLAGVFGSRGSIRKKMNMYRVVLCSGVVQGWDGSWMR